MCDCCKYTRALARVHEPAREQGERAINRTLSLHSILIIRQIMNEQMNAAKYTIKQEKTWTWMRYQTDGEKNEPQQYASWKHHSDVNKYERCHRNEYAEWLCGNWACIRCFAYMKFVSIHFEMCVWCDASKHTYKTAPKWTTHRVNCECGRIRCGASDWIKCIWNTATLILWNDISKTSNTMSLK